MEKEILNESTFYVLIIGYSSLCSFIVKSIVKESFNGRITIKSLIGPVFFSFVTPILILIYFPFARIEFTNEYLSIYISIVIVNLLTTYITFFNLNKNYWKDSQKKELIRNLFLAKWEVRDLIAENIKSSEGYENFNQFYTDEYYIGKEPLKIIYKKLNSLSESDFNEE